MTDTNLYGKYDRPKYEMSSASHCIFDKIDVSQKEGLDIPYKCLKMLKIIKNQKNWYSRLPKIIPSW